MKIVNATARVVDIGQDFNWGGRRETRVHGVHICVEAADGQCGDAVGWPGDLPAASVVAAFDACVKPLVEGALLSERTQLLEPAWRAFRVGMPFPAIGLTDVALWDLLGRSLNLPITQLLGQRHNRLKACASAPPVNDVDDSVAMTAEILRQGFRAIKLHSCGDVNRDIEVCTAVREAAGTDADLMMDVMAIYDRRSALALGQVLDALNYRWYEDPLPDTDLDGWRELRDRLSTPLAGVDAVRFTVHEYARPVADGAFDIVRMDGARNGISQLSALGTMAGAFGVGCEGHAFGPVLAQAANLQVGLATPAARFCELPIPLGALDLGVVSGIQIDPEGYVLAPAGPGLGLEVNRAALDDAVIDARG